MYSFLAQTGAASPEAVTTAAEAAPYNASDFTAFVVQTWIEGGWVMIPLAALAFFLYFEAMALVLRLARAKVTKVSPEEWQGWITDPSQGSGHVGDVIRFVTAGGIRDDALLRLDAVKTRLIPEVNRKITVLSVLVTIAPLMGLLGTVIGMLATFRGLAGSSGQAAELVAEGIRVALITTQTGLMIAIPGYIFIALVVRKRNQYLAFLTELESTLVQQIHHHRKEAA